MMHIDMLLPCPYERSHLIYESRYQAHLVKCQVQHKDQVKLVCPFNATHRLDNVEILNHLKECPNRRVIENYIYEVDSNDCYIDKMYQQPSLPEQEEDWDSEPWCPTYNPLKYTETALVIRKPVGVSRSERKKFYKNEVIRFNRLLDGKIDDDSSEADADSGVDTNPTSRKTQVNKKAEKNCKCPKGVKLDYDQDMLGLGRGFTRRTRTSSVGSGYAASISSTDTDHKP